MKIIAKICNFVTATARHPYSVIYLFDFLMKRKGWKRLHIVGFRLVANRLQIFGKKTLCRHRFMENGGYSIVTVILQI